MTAGSTTFERFRALHHGDRPLLLANAWDHASGAALMAAGCTALGTTSLGVAAALGRADGVASTLDETVRLGCDLARLPVPVSVDLEGGFADGAREVAEVVARLADAGVAGINLEDGRDGERLVPVGEQCELITAVKARTPGVFVNARTDTYWLARSEQPSVDDTLARLEAYVDAGADGVFLPACYDDAVIRDVVALGAPVNILYRPDRQSVADLAALGVRRISLGSLLFRVGLLAAVDAFSAVRGGCGDALSGIPTYAEVQALSGHFVDDAAPDAPLDPGPG